MTSINRSTVGLRGFGIALTVTVTAGLASVLFPGRIFNALWLGIAALGLVIVIRSPKVRSAEWIIRVVAYCGLMTPIAAIMMVRGELLSYSAGTWLSTIGGATYIVLTISELAIRKSR